MTALRWGVLSTALINRKVLAGARGFADVRVTAVASRDRRRAEEFAAEWQIPHAFGAYDAMLDSSEIDAVYISLPNGLHHEWTMRALRAGKHVLCEKPYSRHLHEVQEAFDEAEQRSLVLSEAFMFRYNPQTQALVDLVESEAIGSLRVVNASFSWPTTDVDVRLDPAMDGGSLLDVGVYAISAARLLAGEPIAASGNAVVGPTGVDTSYVGTLAFGGGVLAHFDCGFHLPDRSHLEVVGSLGTIRVSDPWHCYQPGITVAWQEGRTETRSLMPIDSYGLELDHFTRTVDGDPTARLLGRADAEGQARTLELLESC